MRPRLDLGGEPRRVGIECGHRMAVRHEVGAHAAPDIAEADEPDACVLLPVVSPIGTAYGKSPAEFLVTSCFS